MTDPAIDVFEQDGELIVEMGLAGVRLEHLTVNACGPRLLIRGRCPAVARQRRYRLRERSVPEEFARELTLPAEACLDLATARFAHGVLRVCIPLVREDAKPVRPIPVEAGA